MPDREKLIDKLETEAMATDKGYVEVPLFLFSKIIAMLKEQEAVKIEVKKINNSGRCGRCPNCLIELNEMDYPNYCGYCGRPVKWE